MKISHLLFSVLFMTTFLVAQKTSVHYSNAFKKAVSEGTRTYTGRPGPNYWINKASYKIKANIDVNTRTLNGSEKIMYKNNSPSELTYIHIRLYQDFYKKGNTRSFPISPEDVTEGVKIKKIIVDGKQYDLNKVWRAGTRMAFEFDQPLLSGDTTSIEVEWSFIIPESTSPRMGAYDESSFFVGYWYPQISVFDDIDGWDTQNYDGVYEFYNDFNDFEVEITMPKNFIVWGTGVLQNPKEVLADKYYNRYQKAKFSDDIISVIDSNDLAHKDFTPDQEKLVWKFKVSNVPDFSFATSDHYLWDQTSLLLDPQKPRVMIGTAYKKESKGFYNVADISKKSILYFSNEMPGVKYPWPSMLVFNGNGGTEFTMMVNQRSSEDYWVMVDLTSHEILHTYFPFYTGTNETKYAFMDEGWAMMLPLEFQKKEGNYNPLKRMVSSYEGFAGGATDIPLRINSSAIAIMPYYNMAYDRAGLAKWFLMDAVGKPVFKKAIKKYISLWKGKHPVPYDFYHTFEDVIGENLDWFWKPWFFEFGAPDLEIKKVSKVRNIYKIRVNKIGKIPVPVKLELFFDDGSSKTYYESCRIWKNKSSTVVKIKSKKNAVKVMLGSEDIPDVNKENNKIEL